MIIGSLFEILFKLQAALRFLVQLPSRKLAHAIVGDNRKGRPYVWRHSTMPGIRLYVAPVL